MEKFMSGVLILIIIINLNQKQQLVLACAQHGDNIEHDHGSNHRRDPRHNNNVKAGEVKDNNQIEYEKLENIVTAIKQRQKSIDPKRAASGVQKYLISSEPERNQLTLHTGTPAQLKQYQADEEAINSDVYSNFDLYNRYIELNEFIDEAFLPEDHINNAADKDERYWTPEKKLEVIRELDSKFGHNPAWGRYWNYKFDKILSFMEKYG